MDEEMIESTLLLLRTPHGGMLLREGYVPTQALTEGGPCTIYVKPLRFGGQVERLVHCPGVCGYLVPESCSATLCENCLELLRPRPPWEPVVVTFAER